MARRGSYSVQKRLREARKRQQKMEKDERRAVQAGKKTARDEEPFEGEGDPDLAGMVPGPQAPPEEFTR
jgi:hypothetical protein